MLLPQIFRRRTAALLASALLSLLAPALPAANSAGPTDSAGPTVPARRVVIVGASSDSFPLAYEDADGRWTGFTADLLDQVARVMHLELRRVSLPGLELHDRFNRGEFDMLQAYSQTPDRDASTDFSVPFLTLQGTLFVRKNDTALKTLADFRGRKFAIISRRSIGERFVRDHNLGVEAVYVASSEEGLRLVENGTCAGTFLSHLTALSVIDRAQLKNVTMFGAPFEGYDIRQCFAVHKGDTRLLARLNEGLAILNRTGEFQKLYDRWFGRLDAPVISRTVALRYAALLLILLLLGAAALWLHHRVLRRQIAAQTGEITAQKALLQTLYDNIPLAICLLQREPSGFRVLTVNKQAEPWIGLPLRALANSLVHELPRDSEWIKNLAEILSAHTAASELVREERRLLHARKRIIYTLVPMTPSPDGLRRLCVLGEDVTERRTLDEEISQSRRLRAIGELVGGIAHEFNNLLTPIVLKTGEIQLDWAHDERLRKEMQLMSDSALRAAELTRRLLTFGRKDENRIEDVRLGSIVTACYALLKLTVDRRIVWEISIPHDLPPIAFNPTDLNQIILNLVLNARDTLMERLAAPRAEGWVPTIRIQASHLPASSVDRLEPSAPSSRQILGWQHLSVADNGMGMTHDIRERIFEPFYTTKDVGKGTGLGLATVWHLVTEVSGRIEVDSTPGIGTTFHVYLPMLAGSATPATLAPRHEPPPAQAASIFLAEDDALVATAVTESLRRVGHRVTHHPDGASAWQHIQTNLERYELLVLDVNMPGLDGIELARRIRNTGRYAGRIMIISGRLGSDDIRQITEARVDCVLTKPFSVTEFIGAVRDCLWTAPR